MSKGMVGKILKEGEEILKVREKEKKEGSGRPKRKEGEEANTRKAKMQRGVRRGTGRVRKVRIRRGRKEKDR